eukprot:1136947-Pelagomonas_calceolata.AAC.1
MSDSKNLVEPNGAGITNTIGRAELAAIATAIAHEHTHCHGQPQLTSPTQKANPVYQYIDTYPEKHRHHVQGDVLKTISNLTHTTAKYQASIDDILEKNNNLISQLTNTSVPSAGPGGNPFYNIAWLAQEEARPTIPELSSPIPNLVYPPT